MIESLAGTGRLTDVMVQDNYYPDPITGLPRLATTTVYADLGMLETIQKVEGVKCAFNSLHDVEYTVFFDPRYDREWVKAEIEAAIRCAE